MTTNSIASLYKVRAINPVSHPKGEDWITILVNTDKIAYVQPIKEGEFSSHYIVGFDYREYLCHRDDLSQLFEI